MRPLPPPRTSSPCASPPPAGATATLVDGGLFALNPAMMAYADLAAAGRADEIELVGRSAPARTPAASVRRRPGLGRDRWAHPLIDIVFDGLAQTIDYELGQILGPERYVRLQTRLDEASDALDDAGDRNLEAPRREGATARRRPRRRSTASLGPSRAAEPAYGQSPPEAAARHAAAATRAARRSAECTLSRSRRICASAWRSARIAARSARGSASVRSGSIGRRRRLHRDPEPLQEPKPMLPLVALRLTSRLPGRRPAPPARRPLSVLCLLAVRTADGKELRSRTAARLLIRRQDARHRKTTSSSCRPPVRTAAWPKATASSSSHAPLMTCHPRGRRNGAPLLPDLEGPELPTRSTNLGPTGNTFVLNG